MSLGGYFNDLLTFHALGTADAREAGNVQADQILNTGSGINPNTGLPITITNSNQDLLNEGMITQAQYDQTQQNFAADAAARDNSNVTKAFTDALGNEIKNPLGTFGDWLKKIPFQYWVIAGIVLFIYLGGLGFLARRGRERLSR